MLPYGIKKHMSGIHPHNECGICCGKPPLTKTPARAKNKKIAEAELNDFLQGEDLTCKDCAHIDFDVITEKDFCQFSKELKPCSKYHYFDY